jgi:two-component system nitrate/nitrite response regulator NarL
MRVVICDQHIVFAESLSHVLTLRGHQVVAVARRLSGAIDALNEEPADVCLIDPVFGTEIDSAGLGDMRRAAPTTAIVFLTARVDRDVRAAAAVAGARALAEKRQSVGDVITLLDRVHAGESVLYRAYRRSPAAPAAVSNDAQRLAAFLTPQERHVLSALVRGDDTAELARSLRISATTVRCHVQSVLTKMGAHSRLEVATTAVRAGVVSAKTGEWVCTLSR